MCADFWYNQRQTMKTKDELEMDAYLAKIRKTIADSKSLVAQAELRVAETDRFLAGQGLTRAQVMAMSFTDSQREAVNRELARLGMEPLAFDDVEPAAEAEEAPSAVRVSADEGSELENRRMKFSMMMKPFRI